MRTLYAVWSWILFAAIVVQVGLAGYGAFYATSKLGDEGATIDEDVFFDGFVAHAIFGYLVGNEIASTMIRWLGVRRVTEFVEHLIRIGREADPNVLFSYASYPPTEFLLPQNSDFSCFNVYLHDQDAFERYLLRLQNLSEDRPLILGEFGMARLDADLQEGHQVGTSERILLAATAGRRRRRVV